MMITFGDNGLFTGCFAHFVFSGEEFMAYRYDDDLQFLEEISSENLEDLVYCLTHDKDGSKRLTEELTSKSDYKEFYPDHQMYWRSIAAEIQCFGGNTFANLLRNGQGVMYKEALSDVCDKMKVNYSKGASVEIIEGNLLMKILNDALEKMSPEELRELAEAVGIDNLEILNSRNMLMVFQTVFRAGGFRSYQLTLIIVNAVLKALIGRGLSFAGNTILTRTMAVLAGPIGWAITALWTAFDMAGAAYRVTIPAVIQIAALRSKYLYEKSAADVQFS